MKKWLWGPAVLVPLVCAASASAAQYHVEPLLINGPDTEKRIIAVLGDGYDAYDMPMYAEDVRSMVLDGVFRGDETFRNNQSAFNVYRIDVISDVTGVAVQRWDGKGTRPTNDDVLLGSAAEPFWNQKTVLGYVHTGTWGRCWMEPQDGAATDAAIRQIYTDNLSRIPEYTLILLNVIPYSIQYKPGEPTMTWGGGCGGGGRQVVTRLVGWDVVAHEYGHGIGTLMDEYVSGAYSSVTYPGTVNVKNCSTSLNRQNVAWSSLLSPNIALPTTFNASTMDQDGTVGMFEGCSTYGLGVYRPVYQCRMNGNYNQFCPVCQGVFRDILSPFLDQPADFVDLSSYPGAACRAANGANATYGTDGTVSNGSGNALDLSCPARRLAKSGVFTTWSAGEVDVVDRHGSQDVCCSMVSRRPDGTQIAGTSECSSGSSASPQKLHLDLPKVHDTLTFSHFEIQCSVPPIDGGNQSMVHSYRVGQQSF